MDLASVDFECTCFLAFLPKFVLQYGTDSGPAAMQSARETLESSIRFVEGNPEWNARVVYGDTDSMFVLLPGRFDSLAYSG